MIAAPHQSSTNAQPAAAPALEVHDMTVAYHRKPVLWDIDLAIPEGNLVGAMRYGKTDV